MQKISYSDNDTFEATVSELHGRLVLIAGFCASTLKERDLGILLQTACAAARDGLQTEFVSLWEYQTDDASLLMQTGIGWQHSHIGQSRIVAIPKTATFWSWRNSQSASAGAGDTGAMFRLSRSNVACGIRQAISVAIPTEEGEPFGVLEVGCRHRSAFTDIDILYLQAIASRLGAGIARHFGKIREEDWAARASLPRYRSGVEPLWS